MDFRSRLRERREKRRRKRPPEQLGPDIDFGPNQWDDEPPEDWPRKNEDNEYPRYINTHPNPLNRALLG